MFNKNLGAVEPFVSDIGNEFFARISGNSYNDDHSFVATLRALLFRRMPEDRSLTFCVDRKDYSIDQIKNADRDTIFNAIFEHNGREDHFTVINYRGDDECISALFSRLDNEEDGYLKYAGGEELKDLSRYVEKYVQLRVYINREIRSSIILVQNMDIRKYHFIQSFIIRCLPWYFADAPLNDLERDLVKSFREKYSTDYERLIEVIGKTFDLRDFAIKRMLGSFEKNARRQELTRVKESISDTQRQIGNNQEQYRRLIEQLDNQNIRFTGLQHIIDNAGEGSELIEYFQHNKMLTPVRAENTQLTFIVRCFLEFFDLDIYERYSCNGGIYNISEIEERRFCDKSNRKRLMDAIFSETPKLRVKICAVYTLDTRGNVGTHSGYSFPSEFNDCIPNPHLQLHRCLGQYGPRIQECLINGDALTAIEQCIASARSINIAEFDITVRKFLRWIFNSKEKIIQLEDGTDVTPIEALEWLEANEKK